MLYLLLLLLSLVGCSENCERSGPKTPSHETAERQIFRMNTHSEPATLDPRLVRDIPTVTTAKMLFEGLFRKDLCGNLSPALAIKVVPSQDKKCYLFFLRDATWSNGKEITAYDFEYSWKSVLNPSFPAEYAYLLYTIKNGKKAKEGAISIEEVGVKALDAKTLIINLEKPDPYFLELTSFPLTFPIPSELAEENQKWAHLQGQEFICSGPFSLDVWNHASELKVKKNEHYWDAGIVQLDEIILSMVADEHTELNMYENGELDWAGSPNSSIPPEALPTLKAREGKELFILPIAATFCYKFNTNSPPFDQLKMRKAFSQSINRKELVEDILQANQMIATSLLPPCLTQDSAEQSRKGSAHEEALQLFEEALLENGWTRETMPSITLIFSKSEKHHKLAQAVQQQWSNLFNIKIQLQSYEWNTFLDHLSKGNFQVGGKGWVSDLSDPKLLLEVYHAEERSGSWKRGELTSLLEKIGSSQTMDERSSLIAEAETLLHEEVPIAPLYHSTACFLKKPYVKNVYISKLCDLDFKWASIER